MNCFILRSYQFKDNVYTILLPTVGCCCLLPTVVQIAAMRLKFKFVSFNTFKKRQQAFIKLEICVTHGQSSGFKNRPREKKTWKIKETRFVQQSNQALKQM